MVVRRSSAVACWRRRAGELRRVQRQIDHLHRSREVDGAIGLNGIEEERFGDAEAEQLAQTLPRQLRIEAQREMRREGETRLLVRQPTQLDLLVQRANRPVRID